MLSEKRFGTTCPCCGKNDAYKLSPPPPAEVGDEDEVVRKLKNARDYIRELESELTESRTRHKVEIAEAERREFPTIFPHGYADEVARAVLAVLKEGGGR